jgi:hypothetical protein
MPPCPILIFFVGQLPRQAVLKKILGRDTLQVPEKTIFLAVHRWVGENIEGGESDVVEDLVLSCVRLEAIPLNKLMGDVRQSKLVSDSAILDAVKSRLDRGLLSDSRDHLHESPSTTRGDDMTLEPKTPKKGDNVSFKASYAVSIRSSSACSTFLSGMRGV